MLEFCAVEKDFPSLEKEIIPYSRIHGRSLLSAGAFYALGYVSVKFLLEGFSKLA